MGKGSWTAKQRPVTLPVPPDNGAGKEEDTREECPQCGKKYKNVEQHILRVHSLTTNILPATAPYPWSEMDWVLRNAFSAYKKQWPVAATPDGPLPETGPATYVQWKRAWNYHEAQQP